MTTDPISDFLIRIKNAYMARKEQVIIPHSKMKAGMADVLKKYGYISKIDVQNSGSSKRSLVLDLIYLNKTPKFNDVEIVSSPGKRVYIPYSKIPKVLGGLGITIISTSKGIMSGSNAKKNKIGGELICKIW